ncbi:recombinase family protein [Wukongibacter sp. M2B1]|uniref:recombinase family protein n=1 Tax=Wukongibacter sp. M2B1 TaxID=3088895 RepID=UPI003D79EAC0
MVDIAIYSRKSKLTGKGESIQNQIDLCKDYAEKHFKVNKFYVYEDEGYSGGNIKRPKYTELLKDLKNNKFDVLICYRLDRISRNISDFSGIVELLEKYNIDFVSIREQFDTSTPIGRAMMYIASVFAQLERETIAERIRDNMQSLARTGRWLGGKTPMGFESQQIHYLDENGTKRRAYKLSPLKEELKIVKLLYDKYLELESLTRLESWTLENNMKTRSNIDYGKSSLKIILTNPVYVVADKIVYEYFEMLEADIASSKDDFDGIHGLMVFNKHDKRKSRSVKNDPSEWIVAVAKHKGIVSAEDWIKVQRIVKVNSKKAPRSGTGKHGLITRLLRCGKCGSRMKVNVYKRESNTYYYYKCLMKERSRGERCNVSNLNGRLADRYVLDEISNIDYRKDEIYEELIKIKEKINKSSNTLSRESLDLKRQIASYRNSIDNLTIQLAENKDSEVSKYIISKIEEFDKEIIKLDFRLESIKEMKEPNHIYEEKVSEILSIIEDFGNNIDKLTFKEKKRILNEMIDDILWDGEKIKINILE